MSRIIIFENGFKCNLVTKNKLGVTNKIMEIEKIYAGQFVLCFTSLNACCNKVPGSKCGQAQNMMTKNELCINCIEFNKGFRSYR